MGDYYVRTFSHQCFLSLLVALIVDGDNLLDLSVMVSKIVSQSKKVDRSVLVDL